MKKLKIGDYVLATKWSDGDPKDHWCIGIYSGEENGRHYVVDKNGNNFRGNGFRRAKKITSNRGKWMLDRSEEIEHSGRSVWGWLRAAMSQKSTT